MRNRIRIFLHKKNVKPYKKKKLLRIKRAKALKNNFLVKKKVNSFLLWSEHFKLFDVAVDFDVVYFSRFESYILVLQSLSDTAALPYGYQCLANPLLFD